jgi:hypothetical protein
VAVAHRHRAKPAATDDGREAVMRRDVVAAAHALLLVGAHPLTPAGDGVRELDRMVQSGDADDACAAGRAGAGPVDLAVAQEGAADARLDARPALAALGPDLSALYHIALAAVVDRVPGRELAQRDGAPAGDDVLAIGQEGERGLTGEGIVGQEALVGQRAVDVPATPAVAHVGPAADQRSPAPLLLAV